MSAMEQWAREQRAEIEAKEADLTVKEVAIILRTRDMTGTPWLDWDVWEEQSTDDERLDALTTAEAVVEYMREHDRPADVEVGRHT